MRWRSSTFAFGVVALAVALACAFAGAAYADDDGSSVAVGVEWVGQYTGTGSPMAIYGNLSTPDDCVGGLYNIASDPRTNWLWAFNWGNGSAWDLDWKRPSLGGNAYRLADDVDLVAFSGHGTGNNMQFATCRNDWSSTINELDLGLRDCEWALMYTCNFLRGTPAAYGPAANGAHLICGYATDMTVTGNGGTLFAHYAKPYLLRGPYGVRVAWYKYGQATQSAASQNVARTFGARTAVNDYLWGYGPVSADPAPYSTATAPNYAYWDTRLNW
jgi:hypothetical protein